MACRVWLYSKLLPRADRLRNSVHGRIACLQSCEHLPPRPLTGQNDRMHGVLRALRHRSGQRSTNVFVFLWLNPHCWPPGHFAWIIAAVGYGSKRRRQHPRLVRAVPTP